jgi:hypothetical protein
MNGKLFILAGAAILALLVGLSGTSADGLSAPSSGQAASTNVAPSAVQDFEDVPPNNTFFDSIRNIYRAGIISGYPCNGPGEPCGPDRLPYYRPGAFVNRSQMAKFVDLARRQPGIFIDTTTDGRPIFSRTSTANGRAIEGDSVNGNGLHGVSNSGTASGVYGEDTNGGFGVAGRSNNAGSAVYGDNTNTNGYAGYFNGRMHALTCCESSVVTLQVDHPLDPANKYLNEAAVQSPDMLNMYNGNATLDAKGEATVQLPAWFTAANRDFRYQLTSIGAPGPNLYVAQEVNDNTFKIAGGAPGGKVSWQLTGVRNDPYAQQHPVQVEQTKSVSDQGKYVNPDLYGQPDSQRIGPSLP